MLGTDAALALSDREAAEREARGSNGGEHLSAGRECQFVRQSNVERFSDQRQPQGEGFGQIYVGSGTCRRDKGTWFISTAQFRRTYACRAAAKIYGTVFGSGITGRPYGYEDRALILVVYAGLMGAVAHRSPDQDGSGKGWKTRWLNLRRTQRRWILSAECWELRSPTSLIMTSSYLPYRS